MKANIDVYIEEILNLDDCPTPPDTILDLPFAEVIWPWIQVARTNLHKRLYRSKKTFEKDTLYNLLSDEALLSLEYSLVSRWSFLCTPTMLFEMKIHNLVFCFNEKTPRERYLDFIQKAYLNREGLSAFLREYKELARLIGTFLEFWVDQTVEFLNRLEVDAPLLARIFNQGQPLGKVTSLQMDAGDTHHEGRAVAIILFSCGKRIVYKPKNILIAHSFNAFIDRLNSFKLSPALKSYTTVPRQDKQGDYGWEEAVEHKPCVQKEEVDRYFERAGMLLCLMYLLDGTDMHFENIIAAGEFPVLIDLETLFHAQLHNSEQQRDESTMQHSVLVTGLLPFFVLLKTGDKGIDLSGLGQTQRIPSTADWENIHTDEMKKIDSVPSSFHSTNQVIYRDGVVETTDYPNEIVKGFCTLYDLVAAHRNILESENWLSRMEKNPVRTLLRPTRLYAYLLYNLYSPHALLNPTTREEKFELLAKTFGRENPMPPSIQAEEKKALLDGDIPCFNTFPFSTDLFLKQTLVAPNCLAQSASQSVGTRLKQMSSADRQLQVTFIQQALHIKTAEVHASNRPASLFANSEHLPKSPPSDHEIVQQAIQLATQLRKQAIVSEDGSLGWIHLDADLTTEQYNMQAIGYSLYSGRIGIALFFSALGRVSGQGEWITEALCCLHPLRKFLKKGNYRKLINTYGIGGMAGIGGIIYGLFHIGTIGHLPELIEEAKILAYTIEKRDLEEDDKYDLVFGSTGLLLALLSLDEHDTDPKIHNLAIACGDHLCNQAQDLGSGALAWGSPGDIPLLGLSHGTSGIAYALLKLAQREANPRFVQTAEGALRYERSLFCSESKNWLRLGGKRNMKICAWCHGATGVGLARIGSLPLLTDSALAQEIDIALETTQNYLGKGPLTLCCGPLGRLEFLKEASRTLGRSDLDPIIERTVNAVYQALPQLNMSDTFYSPSFMQGVAGLGYTLLRQIDKAQCLPQVLLLQ